jgi:hypothetical protein
MEAYFHSFFALLSFDFKSNTDTLTSEVIYIYIYIYICVCVCVCVCGGGGDNVQGGSNMTGTNCDLFTHKQSRSYLNHLVHRLATYLNIRFKTLGISRAHQ